MLTNACTHQISIFMSINCTRQSIFRHKRDLCTLKGTYCCTTRELDAFCRFLPLLKDQNIGRTLVRGQLPTLIISLFQCNLQQGVPIFLFTYIVEFWISFLLCSQTYWNEHRRKQLKRKVQHILGIPPPLACRSNNIKII